MRLVVIVLSIIAVIVAIFLNLSYDKNMVTIHKGNISMQPVAIDLGHYQDSFCGMVIDDIKYTSEVVVPDGRTWFFHDHADFVSWLQDKNIPNPKIWVYAIDKQKYLDAKKCWYSVDEKTPMESGFGAYATKQDGFIDYNTMKTRVLRGETMANPKIRQKISATN